MVKTVSFSHDLLKNGPQKKLLEFLQTRIFIATIPFLMAKICITRKILLYVNLTGNELKEAWDKLRQWNYIIYKTANFTATHPYIQQNMSEFFYLHEDVKVKLLNRMKDEAGVFTTSRPNTTYQLNSKKFKGQAPMAMVSAASNVVTKTMGKEWKAYSSGERSLRTYRRDIDRKSTRLNSSHIP